MGKKVRKHPKKDQRVADRIYESEKREMEKALRDLVDPKAKGGG